MKVILATDHAGFALKEKIKEFLLRGDYDVEDLGAHSYDEEDDYPDFLHQAAARVRAHQSDTKAIVFGKSGQGEAIVANRYNGVRAAVFYGGNREIVRLSREHNDANILSLGAGFITEEEAQRAVSLWLATNFSEEKRHRRRIEKIDYD